MKKSLLIFFFLPFFGGAQNLVPNPSFEIYSQCPSAGSQISYATGWMSFAITPDYFHTCATNPVISVPYNWFGYQQPASGNAYAGLITKWASNTREYIGIQLTDTLIIGKAYNVSFKANLCLNSSGTIQPNCATNNLGVLFTTYPFFWDGINPNTTYPFYVKNFAHTYINQIITDTTGWTVISDTVIADSSYTYMVIGNFFVDSLTSFIKYFVNANSTDWAYYFIDDIYVGEITTSVNEIENNNIVLLQYAEDIITVNIPPSFISTKTTELKIYNLMGQQVFKEDFEGRSITANINNLTKGMYIILIQNGNKIYSQKIIK